MKVLGQLEGAQLEQIASASPTPTPTGRMYIDVTTPTVPIPRIYMGSAGWKPINMGQSSAAILQNSGKACTVDWSTGLVQEVVLTDNATISFSNPVAGATHTLIIVQATSTTIFCFALNMTDQDTHRGAYQPQVPIIYNQNRVYQWVYVSGIKAAITSVPALVAAPVTAAPTLITGMDLSPDGKTLSLGRTSSPFLACYDISESWQAGNNSPFGLQNITTPATLAAQAVGASYGLDGKSIYIVSGTTPFIQGWQTNRGIATTVFANPGTLPPAAGRCINIHPSGNFVGVGHTTTPFMSIYPLTGSGYGTKVTDPVSLPAAAVTALAWSAQGDYLAAASQSSPFIQVWAFTASPGTGAFGAVSANPGTLPSNGPAGSLGRGIAWRPQGDYIAMANATTPFLYVVPFNRATGAFGTALTVTNIPAGATTCVAWSPDGQYLIVGCGTTPFLYIYDFGSALLNTNVTLAANPGNQVNEIVVRPDGELCYLGLNAGTPFITAFQMPTKARNYVRISP